MTEGKLHMTNDVMVIDRDRLANCVGNMGGSTLAKTRPELWRMGHGLGAAGRTRYKAQS